MKLSKFYGLLAILIGAVIAIGPWTFAYACRKMKDGADVCHTTRLYALGLGLAILIVGVLLMKVGNFILDKILTIVELIGGLATIALPLFIAPVCNTASMHCRTTMLPMLIIAGIVLTILSLIFLFKGVKKEKPEEPAATGTVDAATVTEAASQTEQADGETVTVSAE